MFHRAAFVASMESIRRAVIDIGTNSVKLLVADVAAQRVTPCLEISDQTRLGRGFYETHELQIDPIRETARAVTTFAGEAKRLGAQTLRVVATSAARDAVNARDLVEAIQSESGQPVEIITGEQEAEWVYRGVISDPQLQGNRLLILDVGGGSTEFIVGEKSHHVYRQSFAMGSVRLMETLRPQDPPSLENLKECRAWLEDYFNREIGPSLQQLLGDPPSRTILLVGTGGTTSILARMEHGLQEYDRRRIEGTRLSRRRILDTMLRLWSLSLDERRRIVGLPPKRADIILMGAAIYEAVISRFHFDELYVSTRGLRFGALLEPV